ncbi:hydrolase [Asanoa ishikariensis]|uniref:Pimeloyl-ACP methyl ester carboxylesterase n=1 Tax=Asanoa ishikariensis TaxID=137265 RepID=A0A1H3TY30_9ACTN|nr:alpha/beta fold hydrolase [Asanoa ishikariensis]GIF67560.1 hydrolase [Asanoa ishikariensis]SDZ54149.1 Pimeloyl-ACP methyl ester carboxylesterase [Asanoa ishikariensis]
MTGLVHDRRGAGPPLVLLHGIGHHWRAWEPVLDRLAEHHDVIAVDLPGFGHSPAPTSGPAGMPALVAALTSFFTSLGLGPSASGSLDDPRPHVAGNSLGGAIALELAAAGHVASATALSPAGFASTGQLRYAVAVLTSLRLVSRLPTPLVRTVLRSPRLRAAAFGMLLSRPGRITLERAMADTAALRDGPAFRAVARASRGYAFTGQPTVPVTVAWGTRDLILRPRQSAVARRGLPHARHVDLAGCGHVPMSDDPDLVADLILTTTGAKP